MAAVAGFMKMTSTLFRRRSAMQRLITNCLGLTSKFHLAEIRPLFTDEALKITEYQQLRTKVLSQFANMEEKFRERMKFFVSNPDNKMIFTEDLKNMLHMIENKPEDLNLFVQMLKRFNKQNKEMRFGSYVFGPVVMRTLHFLGQPQLAMDLIKSEELDGFFDQLTSYTLVLDNLYKKEMYEEMLQVFELIKGKQLYGTSYPKDATMLALAACYQLNTPESYKRMLKLAEEIQQNVGFIQRRGLNFAAALALNQSDPCNALELLSNCSPNYITVRNLRVIAMADLDRLDDAFAILKDIIYRDSPTYSERKEICAETRAKVQTAVERNGDKVLMQDWLRLDKALKDGDHLSPKSLSSLLCMPIDARPRLDQNRNFPLNTSENTGRPRILSRQRGLTDMEE